MRPRTRCRSQVRPQFWQTSVSMAGGLSSVALARGARGCRGVAACSSFARALFSRTRRSSTSAGFNAWSAYVAIPRSAHSTARAQSCVFWCRMTLACTPQEEGYLRRPRPELVQSPPSQRDAVRTSRRSVQALPTRRAWSRGSSRTERTGNADRRAGLPVSSRFSSIETATAGSSGVVATQSRS